MTDPLVSIIVPVYNNERYIERCILSILAQTLRFFELILVDDGSTDACISICDDYALRDSRIRVIHQVNAGVSAARNRGIEMASGAFISFIDADDWVEKEMYEKLYNEACKTVADYVYCDYYQEKDGCRTLKKNVECIPNDRLSNIKNLIGTWFVSACMSLIRRDIVIQNHICFDTRLAYNEDFNFLAKCLVFVQRISKVNQALYHYDESNVASALHQNNSRQAADEYLSQIDIIDFYTAYYLDKICRQALNHRLVRCLYFYSDPTRDKRHDSKISVRDLITCPYIGIKGKLKVARTLLLSH